MSELIAIATDGTITTVPNTYEGIKSGVDGATIDFLRVAPEIGFYIDDNGMLTGLPLNVPVSIFIGRAIWGPAVLCHGEPDEEGDTLPPGSAMVQVMEEIADQWMLVARSAARLGQTVVISTADSDTLPPPQVVTFASDEEFLDYLEGRS